MTIATIIGTRDGTNWESLAAGPANEVLPIYRSGAFEGFQRVQYLSTVGESRRKKGAPEAPPKAKAKGRPSKK
mgnify:FL=1